MMAQRVTDAHSLKEVNIAYGRACGFALAGYPEKYDSKGLTKYQELVGYLLKQKEIELVTKGWY
jgi:hypothetical protein